MIFLYLCFIFNNNVKKLKFCQIKQRSRLPIFTVQLSDFFISPS